MTPEIREIPLGDPVEECRGIRAGSNVIVYGWRGAGSEDHRKVKRLFRDFSQSGVMAVLDRPLNNCSTKVDVGWLFKRGKVE